MNDHSRTDDSNSVTKVTRSLVWEQVTYRTTSAHMGLHCPVCHGAVFQRDPDNTTMLCENSHPVTLETHLLGDEEHQGFAGFTLSATEHVSR